MAVYSEAGRIILNKLRKPAVDQPTESNCVNTHITLKSKEERVEEKSSEFGNQWDSSFQIKRRGPPH